MGDGVAAMLMEGIGEIDQGILDLGTGDACTALDTGVTDSTDPDGGGMERIGEAIILIMEVIHIPAMDT